MQNNKHIRQRQFKRHRKGDDPARRSAFWFALLVVSTILLLGPASTHAKDDAKTKLSIPSPFVAKKSNNNTIRGKIISHDGTGFDYTDVVGNEKRAKWTDFDGRTTYLLHYRIISRKDPAALLEMGRRLLNHPKGKSYADEAFRSALKLDPKLSDAVERVRKNPKVPIDLTPLAPPSDGLPTDGPGEDETPPPVPKFKNNARPWKPVPDTNFDSIVRQTKTYANEALLKITAKTKLKETDHFLIYSELSPAVTSQISSHLDRAYKQLADLFGLEKDTTVWYGKAIVFIFNKQATYQQLEQKVYFARGYEKLATYHIHSAGRVAISGWRDANTPAWQRALIHQMTRGFIFRHVSNLGLPTWVERGMAGHTANDIIKRFGPASSTDDLAKKALAAQKNQLGANFFGTKPLLPWQHDIAASLVGFMIKENDKGFATFVNAIKAGYTQEDAFNTFFEQPKSELLQDYAKAMHVSPIK